MIAICRRFCCPEGVKELDILNILKSLDANKAHRYDDISIRLLKLLQKSILKQLKTIKTYFEYCLRIRLFPDLWKKQTLFFAIFFHRINQVLSLVIRVSNSLYLSLMRYIMLLIVTLLLKYEVYFWIFPKPLIRYGMMG